MALTPTEPRLTIFGKIAVFLFLIGCVVGAYYLFVGKRTPQAGGNSPVASSGGEVEIGIAYGTEKQRWLEWAVEEFAKTADGKHIKINLLPMGSLEGAHAILAGDKRINAWSPASDAYKDLFLQDWQARYPGSPIARSESLALTPMVFAMWDERYQALLQKYKTLSFSTISDALQEKSGWNSISGKPEWGLFKFGHTNPEQSNSGLMTLVLAAYTFQHKTAGLTLKDVLDANFRSWLESLERGANSTSNSTGNMMREMVLKGPSSFDAVFVYENVAIDYLKNAEGRWGQIKVIYPEYNAWNENPYYVLHVPWSSIEQEKAADKLLTFLLSEPVQKEALNHGFRPANTNVPIKFAESPFVRYAQYGIQVELQKICEPPKADVVNNLLLGWQRSLSSR